MSAIVRGLRRTFRDPDGKRPPGYNSEVAAHVRKRRLQREAADKPSYRLFRGKKDVTEPAVPKAKTRRARFFDADEEYGKKSLVYQAKTGKLQAEVRSLRKQLAQDESDARRDKERDDSQSFWRDGADRNERSGRDQQKSFGRLDGARPRQGITGRRDRTSDRRGYERRDREADRHTSNREGTSEKWLDTLRREGRSSQEQRQDYEEGRDRVSKRNEPASSVVPLAIPYTTAASQFLYGKSVVEAALRSARRRLYKLYVYNGANRSSALQDQQASRTIERLAKRRNVAVQLVDERWQRLLDKMSKGRPHNGYVLEASPLPQPPLAALGPVVTNDASTTSQFTKSAGFQIELGHQSREEADVNGTSTFIPVDASVAAHHRPLVLLLDQVLDPGNLGAILRSASFLGVSAVAVSKHNSATLTSVALKASAGAAEAMALFSVETPTTFLAQSRKVGWKVYTAVPPPDNAGAQRSSGHTRKPVLDLDGVEANDPLKSEAIILVMGSEGEGLPRAIRREADVEVTIANRSGSNVVDSLNVSVATGLLCASFLKGAMRAISGQKEAVAAAVPDAVVEISAEPAEPAETTETAEPAVEEIFEEVVREKVDEKAEEAKARDELNIF
ncbi:hypothetical protein SEUCBS139899_009799 [Sporothrix eucalyptigena]